MGNFNASFVLGAVSFLSLIACAAAAEGGMWFIAIVLLVLSVVSIRMSIKEGGGCNGAG